MLESRLMDARGCLTAAGMDALRRAPAGGAPPELAGHVSGCASCQERLLATESVRATTPGPIRRPNPGRTLLLIGAMLVGVVMALVSMMWLLRG
jgi:hypothetical protein